MRPKLLLALLPAVALVAAGCLEAASPVGDAEAAHSGARCEVGAYVTGFSPEGAPLCGTPPPTDVRCAPAEVVTGFAADGSLECRNVMEVAQEAMPPEPPQPSRPAKSLSVTSQGAVQDGRKTYVVASASPEMSWADLRVTLDGAELARAEGCEPAAGQFTACEGGAAEGADGKVDAGDLLTVAAQPGQTLRLVDGPSNSVILSLVVG